MSASVMSSPTAAAADDALSCARNLLLTLTVVGGGDHVPSVVCMQCVIRGPCLSVSVVLKDATSTKHLSRKFFCHEQFVLLKTCIVALV